MANRSAEKRERQNAKRRMHNRMTKSQVRTAIKKFDAAVASGDKEKAKDAMALSFKLLDSAAGKGALHRNTASRKKSRIYKAYAKLA